MAKRIIKVLAMIILTPILLLAGIIGIQWYSGPHYASAANACINNLRQIDAAKQQWGLEHHASATNTPSWDDLPLFCTRAYTDLWSRRKIYDWSDESVSDVQLSRRFFTMTPNKSPEPTAVGAVRSAIAVHVASRRWLSFFR